MAIIVDPDNLDREQVVFGTPTQQISVYPVGAEVLADQADGATTAGGNIFTGLGFLVGMVGDILILKNGDDAAHYIIATVDSPTSITVTDIDNNAVSFTTTEGSLTYRVAQPVGGTVTDGVTLQAVYSFGKEEWRDDLVKVGGDDLIRHEFPFEAITSESFEVGGTAQHADWNWANEYSRKKVRTGGWAEKNTAATLLAEWTSVVTLGDLDLDTRVYYQQTSVTTTPVDFDFAGPVNEAISVFTDPTPDNRTFLKLFARKKARTYSQVEIDDIGVTTIQPIVNRFPLAHAVDTAILASDAEVLGAAPFRTQATLSSGTGTTLDINSISGTITSTSINTFITDGVQAGDTLHIITGGDVGYYTILSVDSETALTLDTSEDVFIGNPGETFDVTTSQITGAADGALADIDSVTGTLTSATSLFLTGTNPVQANDLVILEDAVTTAHNGVYKVISVNSDTELTIDTTDLVFTTQSAIDFRIVEPGMYLQYKKVSVTNTTPTDYSFGTVARTITRATGTWAASVGPGTIIEIASALNPANNGSYTVLTRDSGTVITLVEGDVLVDSANDAAAAITVFEGFKRDVGGTIYAYNWRLLGNGAESSDCYQFVQHQLRQTTDIDFGEGVSRGDITDLLLEFTAPTGVGLNLVIDDLNAANINDTSYIDHSGTSRSFPFSAAGQILFNDNLASDPDARYWLFFSNDDAGDNLGRDYSTDSAIIVKDGNGVDIAGNLTGQTSISFTYDYDGNVQRGAASAGVNAPVTLVAIGLDTAQFVVVTGTINRSTAVSISAVAALERNYSNAV